MDSVKIHGQAAGLSLPARRGEGLDTDVRTNGYGEFYVVGLPKGRYVYAAEGTYFMATNPTPGTGIIGVAGTGAFSDQESLLYVKNTATVTEGTKIFLDYLTLISTTAGTNGTDVRYVVKIEPNGGADRVGSGGSSITPVNVNGQSSGTSKATIKFGAVATAAAGTGVRLVDHGIIRPVITVVGDIYTFDFGGDADLGHSLITSGTALSMVRVNVAPVCLGPGDQLVMSVHQTAQTVASAFEFKLGYYER